ncbi:hypothetical protein A3724_12945 [Alcanivorax sp. HI0033]|uniref:zinc-ribbon and DUF3426 domain-containing protein n=1 Tax=unclassified Alcanivorax TaxID=2638842 RepID=UPI0007BA8E94|nr:MULTISPECIES: zinc-ribbon and DUF3426 domain-containing protein [unclassified Alcanivorax]KZX73849.1 hypothetical protein A3716_02045 [Alcanivorax sp. HI0011]KZX75068.1 hypothetical protein A3717_14490 [Alcanivorax sp. HI0013]KZY14201.1 hypothetical protein A3725_11515 [Alcanivorax sp. HI0035]KZX61635.1 hypothetical protein A3713_00855 [Alcanivorax sp. HI0003]KZX67493.1 hypothetical protein A3714_10270 [Alcanivorax sp. HI0007]
MAAQYKTRCPHCAAQFKITEEHLKQARGAVRCGSCLQIFQASDYLIDAPPAKQDAADDRWAGALESNPGNASEDSRQTFDDDDDGATSSLSIEGMELSDSFINLDEDAADSGLGEDFSDMQGAGRASHNDNADEAWAEALLKELENEDDPPAKQTASQPASFAPRDSQASPPKAAAQPPQAKKKPAPKPPQDDEDDSLFGGLDLFGDDLTEEPVPLSQPVRERDTPFRQQHDWTGMLKWGGLSALALMVLVAQYAYFNFDDLARTPQWRPLYQQACGVLGCRLPNRTDISKLRGANLVVRSHPDYTNALIVDAILFNEARYPQPFPELELSFSALNGDPVASRRFSPAEYLRGDLTNMEAMPVNTPLHISLEIVDPGEQAVNYNLRLLPAVDAKERVSQR